MALTFLCRRPDTQTKHSWQSVLMLFLVAIMCHVLSACEGSVFLPCYWVRHCDVSKREEEEEGEPCGTRPAVELLRCKGFSALAEHGQELLSGPHTASFCFPPPYFLTSYFSPGHHSFFFCLSFFLLLFALSSHFFLSPLSTKLPYRRPCRRLVCVCVFRPWWASGALAWGWLAEGR